MEEGTIFNKTLEENKIKLKSGDVLLFFTDGVVEARNEENEEFQEDRLGKSIASLAGLDATGIKSGLVKEIDKFVGAQDRHDDLTFIILKSE